MEANAFYVNTCRQRNRCTFSFEFVRTIANTIYETIKDQSLSTLHGKLTTKMPTAGEGEKAMLAGLWEEEVDEEKALDANQATRIAEHLQRKLKHLLKHLDGENPKPPPGWQALASAAPPAGRARWCATNYPNPGVAGV